MVGTINQMSPDVNFGSNTRVTKVNEELHKAIRKIKNGSGVDNPDGMSADKHSALIKHLSLIMDGFSSGKLGAKHDVFALACKAIDSDGGDATATKMGNLASLLSDKSSNTAEIDRKLSVFSPEISGPLSSIVKVVNKSSVDANDANTVKQAMSDLVLLGSPEGSGNLGSTDGVGASAGPTSPTITYKNQDFGAMIHGDVMLALVFACLATYEAENESLRPIAAEATTNANAVQGLNAVSNFSQKLSDIFSTYNAENKVPIHNLDKLITAIVPNSTVTPAIPGNPELVQQLTNAVKGLGDVGAPLNKLSFSVGAIGTTLPTGPYTLAGWSKQIISALGTNPPTPDVSALISSVSVGLIDNVNAQLGITNNGNSISNTLNDTTNDASSYECFSEDDLTGILSQTKQATDSATTITSRAQAQSQTRTTTAQAAMTATMSFLSQWGQILKTAASGQ